MPSLVRNVFSTLARASFLACLSISEGHSADLYSITVTTKAGNQRAAPRSLRKKKSPFERLMWQQLAPNFPPNSWTTFITRSPRTARLSRVVPSLKYLLRVGLCLSSSRLAMGGLRT
jgi:hypothetical protein